MQEMQKEELDRTWLIDFNAAACVLQEEQWTGTRNLAAFALKVHEGNRKRGFWDKYAALKGANIDEALKEDSLAAHVSRFVMLVESELFEAIDPKTKQCEKHYAEFMASKAFDPQIFDAHIRDTFEDEIADTFIRILDLCAALWPGKEIVIQAPYCPPYTYRYKNISAATEAMLIINLAHEIMRKRGTDALFDGLVNCLNFLGCEFGGFVFDHIFWKLQYNETRPFMHGKRF